MKQLNCVLSACVLFFSLAQFSITKADSDCSDSSITTEKEESTFCCMKYSLSQPVLFDNLFRYEVRALSFKDKNITEEFLRSILDFYPHLYSLNLNGCKVLPYDVFARLDSTLHCLEELDLGRTFLSDASIYKILLNCPNLKRLYLGMCRNISLEFFSSIDFKINNLEVLDLRWTRVSSATVIQILEKCPNLKRLNLQWCKNITKDVFESLNLYNGVYPLEYLNLGWDRVSDASVCNILHKCPNLKKLNLEWCKTLTKNLFSRLMNKSNSLKKIILRSTRVSDASLQTLMNYCPELKQVNLSECPNITADILDSLELGHLKYLDVSETRITTDVKNELMGRYRSLYVN